MKTVVTLRMKRAGEVVRAYLADGSGEPIVWDNMRMALPWAYTHKHLFEREEGAVIKRGRFGSITRTEVEDDLGGMKPCSPIDWGYAQEGDELVNAFTLGIVSLHVDLDEYRRKLGAREAKPLAGDISD